ncbi:MAG: hypothetical protein WAT39_13120, partial [Planctomycetota bacterium]
PDRRRRFSPAPPEKADTFWFDPFRAGSACFLGWRGVGQEVWSLRDVDGEPRVVTLDGVVAFQMADFREGNLVCSMMLFSPERAASDAAISGMVRERLYLDATALPAGTKVFTLVPSYGADIVAVCGSVSVQVAPGS